MSVKYMHTENVCHLSHAELQQPVVQGAVQHLAATGREGAHPVQAFEVASSPFIEQTNCVRIHRKNLQSHAHALIRIHRNAPVRENQRISTSESESENEHENRSWS